MYFMIHAGSYLGAQLVPETLRLPNGTVFQLDGIDRRNKVLCEFFSHMGKLKDGQRKKLARDLLKLLAVEHFLGGGWQKAICVADEPASKYLTGRSWCAAVVKEFGFKVVRVQLERAEEQGLELAQAREAQGARRYSPAGGKP